MTAFSHSLMHILTLFFFFFLEYCFIGVADSPSVSSVAPQLAYRAGNEPSYSGSARARFEKARLGLSS